MLIWVIENPSVVTKDDNYRATVAKSRTTTTVDLPWSKFTQGGWGKVVDQQESLEITSTVSLLFTGSGGSSGEFFFQSIGRLGSCK